jgi:hypothetical protein
MIYIMEIDDDRMCFGAPAIRAACGRASRRYFFAGLAAISCSRVGSIRWPSKPASFGVPP